VSLTPAASARAQRGAVRDQGGEVALGDERELRRGRERAPHVLGDLPPQAAERRAGFI